MAEIAEVFAGRRRRLAERVGRRNLLAWILVPGPGLRYFTGLDAHSSERVLLYVQQADGSGFAVVPHFEADRVRAAFGPDLRLLTYRDETGPGPVIARAFGAFGTRPAAFGAEFGVMRLFERTAVEGAVPRARWHPIDADASALRQIKDEGEIEALRQAAVIAREAVAAGLGAAVPGATEGAVAAACQAVLQAHGTTSPFGVMVASGPRSALPHSQTADRTLEPGDLCWIDLGAAVGGYGADITRTACVGAPDPELARLMDVVAQAQQAAIAAVRPGVTAAAVDAAARGIIAQAGLAAHFTHRTGHGLGLEEHEPPYIVDGSEDPLEPGMVFTIEPGIYLPGRGGVRIEDDILVTADGAEVLTR